MSTPLNRIRILSCSGRTLVLRAEIIDPTNTPRFFTTPAWITMLLRRAMRDVPNPALDAAFNARAHDEDESSYIAWAPRFVERISILEADGKPGGQPLHATARAIYEVQLTDAQWAAHLPVDRDFVSTAYDPVFTSQAPEAATGEPMTDTRDVQTIDLNALREATRQGLAHVEEMLVASHAEFVALCAEEARTNPYVDLLNPGETGASDRADLSFVAAGGLWRADWNRDGEPVVAERDESEVASNSTREEKRRLLYRAMGLRSTSEMRGEEVARIAQAVGNLDADFLAGRAKTPRLTTVAEIRAEVGIYARRIGWAIQNKRVGLSSGTYMLADFFDPASLRPEELDRVEEAYAREMEAAEANENGESGISE